MSNSELLHAALALPSEERARFAMTLLDSLEEPPELSDEQRRGLEEALASARRGEVLTPGELARRLEARRRR